MHCMQKKLYMYVKCLSVCVCANTSVFIHECMYVCVYVCGLMFRHMLMQGCVCVCVCLCIDA